VGLIVEDSALDGERATVERLAVRLGVGARQLTRLFVRHLQASPAKVAAGKRLIDETSLPMSEIALQAGFGSLRRFNACLPKSTADHRLKFGAHGERPLAKRK
jgi:AraC family transcriptional regulator, regulatory protein of adaptative response / methylated-DNA-[protein]-cysteine methyltransferase